MLRGVSGALILASVCLSCACLLSLLSDLLSEFQRVESSSLSRRDPIITLIGNQLQQAEKRQPENGTSRPRPLRPIEAAQMNKNSQFVIQSDLELIALGSEQATLT